MRRMMLVVLALMITLGQSAFGVNELLQSDATVTDATTNNTSTILTLRHLTTGTAAAGIGPSLLFQSENGSGTTVLAGTLNCILTDVTAGSVDGKFTLRLPVNSTDTALLDISAAASTLTLTPASGITTVNLLNTGITTANAFGEATTVSLGAATGTMALKNTTVQVGTAAGTAANLVFRAAANTNRYFTFRTGSTDRWILACPSTPTESGSDAGAPFGIWACSDAGAYVDAPVTIVRAAGGAITLARPVTLSGSNTLTVGGTVAAQSGLTVTGDATVGTSVASERWVKVTSNAGQNRGVALQTAGVDRWYMYAGAGAESGANAGSDFGLAALTDAGALIDLPFSIVRAAGGVITIARPTLHNGDLTMADAKNIITNATTGTKIGTAASQKIGFWNAAPIIQPASANQAAVSLDVTVAGADTVDEAAINANFSALQTLINQLRADLVAAGNIKGAA